MYGKLLMEFRDAVVNQNKIVPVNEGSILLGEADDLYDVPKVFLKIEFKLIMSLKIDG